MTTADTMATRVFSRLERLPRMALLSMWRARVADVGRIVTSGEVPYDKWLKEYIEWYEGHKVAWWQAWERATSRALALKGQKADSDMQQVFDSYVGRRSAKIGTELANVDKKAIGDVLKKNSTTSVARLRRELKDVIGMQPRQISAFKKQSAIIRDNLPPAKAEAAIAKLRARKIGYRAKLISQTELLQMGNDSRHKTVKADIKAGRMPEWTKKRWSTRGNKRVCEICEGNAFNGWIPFNKPFSSGHLHPLAHPGCGCAADYSGREKPKERLDKPTAADFAANEDMVNVGIGVPDSTLNFNPWTDKRMRSTSRAQAQTELVKRGLPKELVDQMDKQELLAILRSPSSTRELMEAAAKKYGYGTTTSGGINVTEATLGKTPWKPKRLASTSKAQAQRELIKRGLPEDLVLQMERKELLAVLENPRMTKELLEEAAKKYKWRPGVKIGPPKIVTKAKPVAQPIEKLVKEAAEHDKLVAEALAKKVKVSSHCTVKTEVRKWVDELGDGVIKNVIMKLSKADIGLAKDVNKYLGFYSVADSTYLGRSIRISELTDWGTYNKWSVDRRMLMYREVFHHEIGHAIDHAYNVTGYFSGYTHPIRKVVKNSPEIKELRRIVRKTYRQQVKAVQSKYKRIYDTRNNPDSINWYWDLPVKDDAPFISRYSVSNETEFFSEAIADYVGGGKQLKRLFPDLYNSIKKTIFEGREFTGIGIIKK